MLFNVGKYIVNNQSMDANLKSLVIQTNQQTRRLDVFEICFLFNSLFMIYVYKKLTNLIYL